MENGAGVGVANGSHPGEKVAVEDEVLVSRVEETHAIGLDESKDSEGEGEGDDVFEEAIETEVPRVDSEDIDVIEFGNVKKVDVLDGALEEVNENSIVEKELETFEEAIGVPGEDWNHEEEEEPAVIVEEKVVDGESVGEAAIAELIDGPHEQTVEEKIVQSELNGLVVNEEDEVREVSDIDAVGDMNTSKEGDEVDKDSDVVVDKSEKGISSDIVAVNDLEISKYGEEADEKFGVVPEISEKGILDDVNSAITLVRDHSESGVAKVEKTQVNEDSLNGDVKELVSGDNSSLQEVDSNGELLHQSAISKEVHEMPSNPDTSNQDDMGKELEGASAGFNYEHQDDKVEKAKEHFDNFDAELEGNQIEKLITEASFSLGSGHLDDVDHEKDTSANLDDEHRDDKVENVKKHFDNFDAELEDNRIEKLITEASFSLGSGHLDDVDHEKDTSANLDMKKDDDIESELKDTSTNISMEHHGEICEPKDNLAYLEERITASPEERNATLEVRSSPFSEDSAAETCQKIQPVESHLEAESKAFQIQGARDDKPEVSNAVAESAKKVANLEEVNVSTLRNREQIKTAANVPSLSRKSANPTSAPVHPAGLGRAAPLLEPAPRAVQQPRVNGTVLQTQNQLTEDPTNGEAEENDETREKLQMIRVKFLRLAHRLGQTPHNVVVAQVLYRLGLAEQLRGRNGSRVAGFSFDRASALAEQLEAAGQEPLDFSCTIMVIGKTGVGKSATINSIFDEVKFNTDAFKSGTKKVQDVVGTVQGIKVRVIDTPGLLPSWSDQHQNEKILGSVKRFIKKTPPDIVLYLDRLDMQSRDLGDMPLLRTITEIFGPSIWFNAIVVLTHAASAPPEGPNGTATSYDMFVTQRSHVVQQAIRQAAGDMRLMNPVSLVENHSACRTNRAGQRVLPNGQVWKPHLLLLSFASKILAEANTLLKLQDSPPGKPFPTRTRTPPLPFLLSSLLQSRPELKLPEEQFGDDDDTLDGDLDVSSDSDEESEYDELPPFKRLSKTQLAKLTKSQKKAYYDELEYREKLFMKKQLKDEKRRRKMMKKMAASAKELPDDYTENVEEESGGAASVPVPMPDLALPASFDSDNPSHRYRYLDSNNQWLVRPVLESHGWDHDVGYEGINVERLFVVKDKIPISLSGQVTKDKKDSTLQLEVASSLKHGEGKATSIGFDMQNMGKDIAYTLRSETRFSNYRQNKATAGFSVTVLGDALTAGVKVEDKLLVNKRFKLVMSGGALTGHGDVAYGGSLEATLRDKDYPLGRFLATSGLSLMDWHGDLAIGWNFQAQLPVGRFTNLIGRFNLNNRGSGQVSVRLNSSEQIQLALIGVIPLLRKLLGYPQELQFGHT